jgi:RND family efflux transporter MFP subunit
MCSVRGAYVHGNNLTLLFARLTAFRVHGWPARVLVLMVMPALVSGCSDARPRAAAIEAPAATQQVKAITVTQQPLTRVITVTGTLAAEEQVALSFKVAGRVDQVNVDLGSVVRQGQVVATLASTDFDLRVRQAEAALIQARARLGLSADGESDVVDAENTALVRQRRAVVQEARLNRDRMKTFVDRGLSARATLESADASLEVAEGQYQDALEEIRNRQGILAQRRSELEIARQQLQDSVLRSPLDGAVRERQVSVGEYRAPGTPVLTIVRTHPLRLKLSIPERETLGLQTGLAVRVGVEGDERRHDGRLERIGAAVDEANRTLPVEAVVPNPGDVLRPGQFATAEIIVSRQDRGLVVPRDTIVTFAGVQKVLTVKDGKAREQRIRTGRRDGERVEVVDGLTDGDVVIREPGNLVDGVAVQVVRAE